MKRIISKSSTPILFSFKKIEKDLSVVVFGKVSAVRFADENLLLGQEQSRQESCDSSPDVFSQRNVLGRSVSVMNMLHQEEAKLGLSSTNQDSGQSVNKNTIHAFIFVLEWSQVSHNDKVELEWLQKRFAESVLPRVMLLFTYEREEECDNIEKDLKKKPILKQLLKKCGKRYHTCSKNMSNQSEMRTLLEKIDDLVFQNNQCSYIAEVSQTTPRLRATRIQRLSLRKPSEPETNPNERRIVLLGKTGVGKSATGNTILGEKRFRSQLRFSSVTEQSEMYQSEAAEKILIVVDTPGLFDTKLSSEQLAVEIGRSIYMSCPGPHAFLYVHQINVRFTEQEEQVVDILEMMFGEELRKYMIILFTHGDSLKQEDVEILITENSALSKLVEKCRGYHIFNNEDQSNREQVTDLLEKIDRMVEQNGGSCYSNQMYEDAAKFRQEEEERRQREEEERRQREEKQSKKNMAAFRKGTQKRFMKESEKTMEALHTKQEQVGIPREEEPKWQRGKEQEGKSEAKDGKGHWGTWRMSIQRKPKMEGKKDEVTETNSGKDVKKQNFRIMSLKRKEFKKSPQKGKMLMTNVNQSQSQNVNSAANDPGLDRFLKTHHNHLAAAGKIGAGCVAVGTSAGFMVGAGLGAVLGLIGGPVGAIIGLVVGGAIGGALGAAGGAVAALASSQK